MKEHITKAQTRNPSSAAATTSPANRGGITLPAVPVVQQKATKYVRFPEDDSDLQRYVSEVQALEPGERHELFKDLSYMHVLKSSPKLDSKMKMVMVGALMEGSFKWHAAGDAERTDFDKHFGEGEMAADPSRNRKNATMNCWETILYAAHLVGLYDKEDLNLFQSRPARERSAAGTAKRESDDLLQRVTVRR